MPGLKKSNKRLDDDYYNVVYKRKVYYSHFKRPVEINQVRQHPRIFPNNEGICFFKNLDTPVREKEVI